LRVLILLSLLFAIPAEAQVRRCVNADGTVAYQDQPCPGNTKGAWVKRHTLSETHGGESAAAIEKRAAAIREANYRADQAHIDARAASAAAAAARQSQSNSGLSPSSPASTSGGCSNCTTPSYRAR
jgi:hypothetical protein